jgi:hypothetical protein
MTTLLSLLALAMIASGATAIYSGGLIIAVERGWAMVIAGSVCASSGAILLGIAVAASRLKRIRQGVDALNQSFARITSASHDPGPSESSRVEQVPVEPVPQTGPAGPMAPELRPTIDPAPTAPSPAALPSGPAAPRVPSPVPVMEPAPEQPASVPEPAIPPPAPPPAAPPAADSSPPEPAPPVEREVVGRYAAGENSYVMFSDGSIEAATPAGQYRFASLDELKTFVAARESGTGAAAGEPAAANPAGEVPKAAPPPP